MNIRKSAIFPIFFLSLFLISSQYAWAQPVKIQHRDRLGDSIILKDIAEKPEFVKRPKPKINEFTGSIQIATNGYGILLTAGKAFDYQSFGYGNEEKFYNTHYIELEFSERLHQKEYKDFSYTSILGTIILQNEESYIYGKTNKVYNARLSYGQRRLLGGRGEPGSPLIQYFISGGLSLSLVKPYYLQQASGNYVKYDSTSRVAFLDKATIIGKAPFSKGMDELETVFGLHLKGGLHFDFAKRSSRISAINIGVSADYHFGEISQMADYAPKAFFANIFLNYQFGRRW